MLVSVVVLRIGFKKKKKTYREFVLRLIAHFEIQQPLHQCCNFTVTDWGVPAVECLINSLGTS